MSIASRRVAARNAREAADVKFLNERGVHIAMTRDARGPKPIDRETLHAIAELVRAYDKMKGSTGPSDPLTGDER